MQQLQEHVDQLGARTGRLHDLLQRCVAVAAYEMERQCFEHEAQMKSMHIKTCSLEQFLEQCQEHIKALEDKVAAMKQAKQQERARNNALASGADGAGAEAYKRTPRIAYFVLAVCAVLAAVYAYDVWLAETPGQLLDLATSMACNPFASWPHSTQTCSGKSCGEGDSGAEEEEVLFFLG